MADEEEAEGADDMDEAGRTSPILGLGRALGRSSCETAGRDEGAVERAFMARDRTGAAAAAGLGTAGAGLPADRPGAATRDLAGVAEAVLAGAGLLGPGAGAEGPLPLAFSIKGMMVDLEAGFKPDV